MPINTLLERNLLTSIVAQNGPTIIRESPRSLIITELIVSKQNDGELIIQVQGEEYNFNLLFIKERGTHQFSFPNGLKFWRGAKIVAINNTVETSLITLSYLEYDGMDQAKWRLINGG
jgi:hypothetical protein